MFATPPSFSNIISEENTVSTDSHSINKFYYDRFSLWTFLLLFSVRDDNPLGGRLHHPTVCDSGLRTYFQQPVGHLHPQQLGLVSDGVAGVSADAGLLCQLLAWRISFYH